MSHLRAADRPTRSSSQSDPTLPDRGSRPSRPPVTSTNGTQLPPLTSAKKRSESSAQCDLFRRPARRSDQHVPNPRLARAKRRARTTYHSGLRPTARPMARDRVIANSNNTLRPRQLATRSSSSRAWTNAQPPKPKGYRSEQLVDSLLAISQYERSVARSDVGSRTTNRVEDR